MSCSARWTHSGKNKLGWPLVPNFADVDNAESIRIGAGSHPKLRNGDSAAARLEPAPGGQRWTGKLGTEAPWTRTSAIG
jgi:hypothetical protein